jgi:hypothetical protein
VRGDLDIAAMGRLLEKTGVRPVAAMPALVW